MPIGPGRYDDLCTAARVGAMADGAMLLILGGNKGNGFSVQMPSRMMAQDIARILREVADQIDTDAERINQQ